MPSLKESQNTDLSNYESVEQKAAPIAFPPFHNDLQPVYNPYIRCPLPPISVTPDSLRQYYVNGQVPQFRVLTPPNTSNNTSTTIVKTVSGTTSTTSTGTTPSNIAVKSISLVTAVLNPNNTFLGSISISKSFQLINVSASSPCRIQLYGTASAQTQDAGRGLDAAPTPGTQQNLITDVVLDTIPYQWSFQNRVGANADSPQNATAYMTVTNVDVLSEAITITLFYVPLET